MSEKAGSSGRGLFLSELLIACLIFSFAAAICVRIFAGSHIMAQNSAKLSYAVSAATGGAETYKSVAGDLDGVSRILGAVADGYGRLCVYYDEQWQKLPENTPQSERKYIMEFIPLSDTALPQGARIVVLDYYGNEIYTLEVAV